jgi:hypothetical protein
MATAVDLSGGLDDAVEYGLVDHPRLADMREGVSVWIYDDQGRFGFPRICLEAAGPDFDPKKLQVNLAFPDGRVLIGDPRGAAGPSLDAAGKATIFTGGPLEFRLLGPWQGWSVAYDGLMTDTTTAATIERRTGEAERIPVRFELEVTNAAPPWVQGQMSREADEQLAKTDSIFVGGQKTAFENGLRYEQLVRAKGTLRIGSEEWDFTGSCSRIHRQGFRNLTGFEGHVWQSALFPSGRGFGQMWLLPNNYRDGYIFDGTRMLPAEVVEVSWMTKMYPSGEGEDVSCVLESELGRHEIRAETVYSRYIPIGDEFETEGFWPIHWQQAGVRYTWDGEESYGMMERSSKAEVVSD